MVVALLWVVVVVVVPVHSLSFLTMSPKKKTMRTTVVVALWEVVLRLVPLVFEDVVLRGQMANLAPFVVFCPVDGLQFPGMVVVRQLACGQQCVARLPLEWHLDQHTLSQDLFGLRGSPQTVSHRCESPGRLPFLGVREPLGSESQHG